MSRSNFFWGLLTSQASADDMCRVCKRSIAKGDYVKRHTERVGVACVTCGFWKLVEVKDNASFVAAATRARDLSRDEVYWLVELGLVKANRATKKIAWTACGKRLRDELCGPVAARAADDDDDRSPVSSGLSVEPLSSSVVSAAGGRRR